MAKHVIFLYRGYDKNSMANLQDVRGVFLRPGTGLVGFDLDEINSQTRNELVNKYALREFEVEQEKFMHILGKLPSLGAKLLEVEFSKQEELTDIEHTLTLAIERQDMTKLSELVKDCWDLGHDIRSIEFFLHSNRIRFTWLAELDVSSSSIDIPSIINTYPVGVLSGVIREEY